ncbi:bifunctional diguanylate cyclase/phosphodiesterase [Novosphingobium lentum]|uniref:bifunctional diguanylate cyclase/phosphodiesterase n=1 Tax=Novosphingobium lentum TaxID=145287 RepID=UPI000836D57D|nr:bifunctional diguanylate cyclase/phosphodiesterase [Novosphingobium lentum]
MAEQPPKPPPAPLPAEHDLLTGLATAAAARAWFDRVAIGLPGGSLEVEPSLPIQAMLIGLHRFQAVNLAYGATAGDGVLAEIAHRIRRFAAEELPGDCLAARLGGGEFLLASRHPCSRERWQWLAEALSTAIARPMGLGGETVRLVPRIALLRGRAEDHGAAMLDRLDQALVALQGHGARRILWADGSHRARGLSAARLEADLLGAIDRAEIGIVFQPQFTVEGDRLCGAEALARWDHPSLGRVGAGTLFAMAERADHVVQLSRHIAERALALAAAWPETERPLRLSLNVTAQDLASPDVAARMRRAITASGFAPARLTLEITEQTLIADFATSARSLRELVDDGVSIALDDFGTGFSNFRALKALPLDALKLDQSLVRDIATDPRDRAIVRAIIAMARALDLKLVAEGIELEDQLAVLRAEGCDSYQGFLRSQPVEADAFVEMVLESRSSSRT